MDFLRLFCFEIFPVEALGFLVDTAVDFLTYLVIEIVVFLFVGSLGGGIGLERRIIARFIVDGLRRNYLVVKKQE